MAPPSLDQGIDAPRRHLSFGRQDRTTAAFRLVASNLGADKATQIELEVHLPTHCHSKNKIQTHAQHGARCRDLQARLRPPFDVAARKAPRVQDTPFAGKTKKNQMVIAIIGDNHLIWWENPLNAPSPWANRYLTLSSSAPSAYCEAG
jgi:hypothetical protein